MDLTQTARILEPFYTEAGRRICLAYVKAGFINPVHIGGVKDPEVQEPFGHKASKSIDAAKIARDALECVVPMDLVKDIVDCAFEEAKPELLKRDIQKLWGAYKSDEWYRFQYEGLVK